jgi:hypothetical protein
VRVNGPEEDPSVDRLALVVERRARSCSLLTHQLFDKAAGEISEVTHRPATITG